MAAPRHTILPGDVARFGPPDRLLAALKSIGARPLLSAPRLAYWLPRGEHRLCCPNAHLFTPETEAFSGAVGLRCQWKRGEPEWCGIILLVTVMTKRTMKFVAEVSRADMAHMKLEGYDGPDQLSYLQNEPVRKEVAA